MAEQICPVCGCTIDEEGYEKEGTVYCCEPCATGRPCSCGCCEVVEPGPETEE